MVYIAEAHPVDGWQTDSNEEAGIRIKQAESLLERCEAAKLCEARLGLSIPTLVDDLENTACRAFSAWPERIYILDSSNRVHYRGGQGPWDFRPDEARASLQILIG